MCVALWNMAIGTETGCKISLGIIFRTRIGHWTFHYFEALFRLQSMVYSYGGWYVVVLHTNHDLVVHG